MTVANTTRYDAVVVGGGIAGLSAANRLQQLGGRVVVLEQGRAASYACNSRFSGGVFHICHRDMFSEPEMLRQAIKSVTGGFATDALADALAQDGGRMIRWLQAEGARFINLRLQIDLPYNGWVLAPPAILRAGPDWAGRGGDLLLQTLEKNLLRRGGTLLRGVRARSLITEDGACRGVVAEQDGATVRFDASAVVIADGGFQANTELVRAHIASAPEKLQQRNARTGLGDGLRMAQEAGAATIGLPYFYGHLLSRDAMTNDMLWPKPQLDALALGGIVVDASGRRFMDEGRGGVAMTNDIARLPDPLSTRAIFDHAVWTGPGGRSILANVPANPILKEQGGTLHIAGDLGALAEMAGLPPRGLAGTVEAYNAALSGAPGAAPLDPPRSAGRFKPLPLVNPPFYAAPLSAGITYTTGGILTDGDGCVLDAHGGTISGLYAAGATTGGTEGGPSIGYVGGLARSCVMGLRSAEHIADMLGIVAPQSAAAG